MKVEELPDTSFAYLRPSKKYPYRLFAHHDAKGNLLIEQVRRHILWLRTAERLAPQDDYGELYIIHYCLAHLYGHLSEKSELGENYE